MFDELLVSGHTTQMAHTHKPWTVGVSVIFQAAILGTILLIPLIYTQTLPSAMMNTFLVAPPPPAPPPPPQQAVVKQVQTKTFAVNRMVAPTVIPKQVEIAKDEAPPSVATSDTAGVPGGTGDVLGGIGTGAAPPPPPPAAAPNRVKVGGDVQSASLVNPVKPDYPTIAKSAHVSGTVTLHAIISKDGSIERLEYVSGPPLLMASAMTAVKEWKYRPTMLNGQPVEFGTLQVRAEDAAPLAAESRVANIGGELDDFNDTAAALALCDLVIAVDTAAAHLAGAMGRPVWVLVPYAPDWRWTREGETTPWYPTARLFRQTSLGDWDGVIARVAEELGRLPNPE